MSTTLVPTRPAGRARGRSATDPQGVLRLGGGSGLALGVVMLWMSILVLLPLVAVLVTSTTNGVAGFVDSVTSPAVAASIRLTVLTAAA
ncbi:MAG: sulfate transporter, inner rane subunit CysT, partial [Friedmanniella sp.]|nr:sulfate transporter, inner rane subunit CysT [Friedmanniella sp.]